MSTGYYAVCEKCLSHEEHYHRRSDVTVAYTYFGGASAGLQLVEDTTLLGDKKVLVNEYGDLVSLDDLRARVGNGGKSKEMKLCVRNTMFR